MTVNTGQVEVGLMHQILQHTQRHLKEHRQ